MRSSNHSHSQASALVITLAFVVMLTLILLTYLATTQASLKKTSRSAAVVQTDLLAETAISAIVSDLRQEMLAGAASATNNVMTISQSWAMVPGRVLTAGVTASDTNFINLIKQSVRGAAFYPGSNPATYTAKSGAEAQGFARASAVNSSDAALDGRLISPMRWNKPRLLNGSGFSTTNQLPDWILISRSGPLTNGLAPGNYTNRASETEYVIGRFAYNIYDTGGLVDINVAGYPTSASTNAAQKGSQAWADLSAIPGITDNERFLRWRNTNSFSNYASLISGKELGMPTSTNIMPWGEPGGFRKPWASTNSSDNRYISRQDLLNYVLNFSNAAIATNALPFLTTFSADLNQPSYSPDTNRPKVLRSGGYDRNDAYQHDDLINVAPLSLTNSTGEPLVRSRFPLNRLRHVVPAPVSPDAVRKYFGLIWNPGDKCWDYQPSDESSPASRIKRLSEVSGREPTFLELLQAAITVGSLGNQYQQQDEPAGSPHLLGGRDGSVSAQVQHIAANIIDQYDADSLPTRLRLNGLMAYGIEDLPYLYSVRTLIYRQEPVQAAELTSISPSNPVTFPALGAPYRSVVMSQPSIWNPHGPSSTGGPDRFRITARGTAQPFGRVSWWTAAQWAERGKVARYPSTNPKDNNGITSFQPSLDFITFQRTATGDASFREPFPLAYPGFPAGSNPQPSGTGNTQMQTVLSGSQDDLPGTQAFGFRIGWTWSGPAVEDSSGNPSGYFYFSITEGSVDYELQYHDGSDWVTYDSMESVPPFPNNLLSVELSPTSSYAPSPRSRVRFDPRTDRMGYRNALYTPETQPPSIRINAAYWGNGQSQRPTADAGWGGLGTLPSWLTLADLGWTSSLAATPTSSCWALASANITTAVYSSALKRNIVLYYADPDGVVRKAMGAEASGTNGQPMAVGSTSSRPVILNRPFRSVAELGYVCRGTPWKQLDFWTPESGDAALLDYFCIHEPSDESADPIVSGRINLNSRVPEVLKALLLGGALEADKPSSSTLSSTEAQALADRLTAWTQSTDPEKGPLRNRSELVGRFVSGTNFSGFSEEIASVLSSSTPYPFKRESVLRALSDVGTTRTWTFLIDLIVQAGRYPRSGLQNFTVDGEQRFWLHIAIDRFTGEVISRKLEPVNE